MERYWVYIDSKVQGPVEVPALRKLNGFTLLTQVCLESEQTWRVADDIVEIKAYFLAPPRVSSMPQSQGNLALKLEPDVSPSTVGIPTPAPIIETLPDMPLPKSIPLNVEMPPTVEAPKATPSPTAAPTPSGALRLVCSVCGFKNPRDLTNCMKCGAALEAPSAVPMAATAAAPAAAAPVPSVSPTLKGELPTLIKPTLAMPATAVSTPVPLAATKAEPTMVEIPLSKIGGIVLIAALTVGGGFGLQHLWKKHKAAKMVAVVVPATPAPAPAPSHRKSSHHRHSIPGPHRRYVPPAAKNAELPGVVDTAPPESAPSDTPAENPKPARSAVPKQAVEAPDDNAPVSYHVLPEATPLKKRQHAPIDSTYAQKRRADHGLWSGQDDQAIKQVQELRIYGGQRTVMRNVEILMQILRDREYTSAFETGKRLYYYNDMDWAATPTSGPIYEVQLTFSGGKEADGSGRRPLRFAFAADLERGTVDPTGPDTIKSNTMHAFFDESRIAPDERRAIAKDTEELVMAAQPDGSPLALETIVHHFVGTYGSDALQRVASAYGLTLVKKKLLHDPTISGDAPTDKAVDNSPAPVDAILPKPTPRSTEPAMSVDPAKAKESKKMVAEKPEQLTSTSGPIDFQIENGSGRERNVTLRVPTKASTAHLWETLTGYDSYQQFVPGMLQSQREGQDGGAVIVHTVTLTRFWFFVFKINLHLRIIEHPIEHTLEFERIAGEFENFRGSVGLQMENGSHTPTMIFRATIVPKGHMPDYVFSGMARHLLVSALDAIRAHAEAQ